MSNTAQASCRWGFIDFYGFLSLCPRWCGFSPNSLGNFSPFPKGSAANSKRGSYECLIKFGIKQQVRFPHLYHSHSSALPFVCVVELSLSDFLYWFQFGNYGPKTTPGNHSFIQRILENGYDERPLYNKRTLKSELPTPECEDAVDQILARD